VRQPLSSSGPVSAAHAPAVPEPLATPAPPEVPQVVMDPGRVAFRCEEQGRTTFSDVASGSGCVPVSRTPVTPAPAANGAAQAPAAAPAGR